MFPDKYFPCLNMVCVQHGLALLSKPVLSSFWVQGVGQLSNHLQTDKIFKSLQLKSADFPRPQVFLQGRFWVMRPRIWPPGSSIIIIESAALIFCASLPYQITYLGTDPWNSGFSLSYKTVTMSIISKHRSRRYYSCITWCWGQRMEKWFDYSSRDCHFCIRYFSNAL
jgi:hypothetical protein